jgi:murein L,D-transpeptidase YcbB/YkuD
VAILAEPISPPARSSYMNNISSPTRRAASAKFILALLATCTPAFPAIAAATPPPAQTQTANQQALRSAATDPATKQFYQQNGWQAVWSGSAAQALDQVLNDRAVHGLDHIAFRKNSSGSSSASPPQQEVARTDAALHYAAALAGGVVDPTSLHEVYTLPRPQGDVIGGLSQALTQGNLAAWFASLAPQDSDYATLSKAYRSAEQNAHGGSGEAKIQANGLIHVGESDPRVPDIAQRLSAEGYLAGNPGSQSDGEKFTHQMSEALEELQRDYGIADDGVVGPDTLEVLNVQPGDRARTLAVALERRRWLARNAPATRIDVNLAAARLHYYRDGQVVDTRKVIVGKPGRETPLLMAPIYRLVANPTWTVPKSIENAEMSNVGRSYLNRHNMVRRNGYIVQQPGPNNALGLVKFDMKDDQAIYLHDTGSPSLFNRTQRHLSHGCVRVDNALGFAEMIAHNEGIEDQWQAAHARSDQTFVDLPQELPVRLLYENAFVDGQGQVAFRTDPYGWNGAVAEKLGFGNGSDRKAQAGSIDIGP